MTEREKVAHLLRRFGLGATDREMSFCEPLGVDGTLEYLFEYERAEETIPISAWECLTDQTGQVVLERNLVALWWSLRILTTTRPLEQKLTLFWHNHFAVGGNKVSFAPMYVQYIETLRNHAGGPFASLLSAITCDPAMMRYLDTDSSQKSNPNENFGREVMELFTIGPESFDENDVKQLARCYTGLTTVNHVIQDDAQYADDRLRERIRKGQPMVSFEFSRLLHDSGVKHVLGKQGKFGADDVNHLLASHPSTANRICRKL